MTDGTSELDRYLDELGARLRGLPEAEAAEIREELRSFWLTTRFGRSCVARFRRTLASPAGFARGEGKWQRS